MLVQKRVIGLVASTVTAVAATFAGVALASAEPAAVGVIVNAGSPQAIKDSYIVVFKGGASVQSVQARVAAVTARHGVASVTHTYGAALSGFSASMSEQQARKLAADPEVAYVEQDQVVMASTDQTNPPSWGLDRIDQLSLPLNNRYGYPNDGGSRVHAYVIDTGIRTTHNEFGGRAVSGFDAVDGGTADDCNGHGTHVAGTIGGTTYGVAKRVQLVAVRVLSCAGSGTIAGVVAGVDWVTDHAVKPAVANMSLGGAVSTTLDQAVTTSINSGVHYAVAAGNNSGADACGQSPARVPNAITVGATGRNDARAAFSNIGGCVDIFAPGVDITSAWSTSDSAINTISGTSMAAPHVAGVMALTLQAKANVSAVDMRARIVSNGSAKVTNPGAGTTNKLLRLVYGPITGLASKCANVRGGGTANGTRVEISTCNGSQAQEWMWTSGEIYNGASGRCLDVVGGVLTNRTPTQIFNCNGSLAQTWYRGSWTDAPHTLFVPASTRRCLEVAGANSANGTQLQIFDCNGTAAQLWKFAVS